MDAHQVERYRPVVNVVLTLARVPPRRRVAVVRRRWPSLDAESRRLLLAVVRAVAQPGSTDGRE